MTVSQRVCSLRLGDGIGFFAGGARMEQSGDTVSTQSSGRCSLGWTFRVGALKR